MEDKSLKRILWGGIAIILLTPLISFGIYFSLNHNLNGIQDWLIPVSAFEFLITAAIGSWVAVNNYALKIETEKRLSESSSIESNVRLLKLFSEMMQISNCRYEPILSEKVIEGLFNKGIITANDYKNPQSPDNIKLISAKLETAIITPAHGLASQESAIAAIYTLGRDNAILLDAAIDGLTSVKLNFISFPQFTEDAPQVKRIEKYLDKLKKVKEQKNKQKIL
jgi:hypothetical protein